MIALDALDRHVLPQLALGPPPEDAAALADDAERAVEALRDARVRHAAERSAPLAWWARFDRALRTHELERLDEPDFPAERKVAIVRALHHFNRLTRAYDRFLHVLEPMIRAISTREARPVRVLELASGSGELALALANRAQRRSLAVEITGSDVLPEHVEAARARAIRTNTPVRFEVIDALAMDHIPTGTWDVVLIAQSLHHFSPGFLAQLFRQGARVAGQAFVGIDGARGLLTLGAVPAVTALSLQRDFLHDAWVTVRKLYAPAELRLLAERAAPGAAVHVRGLAPGWTVVEIARRA
jgi:SAM-dependent methyltransferase